MNLFTDITGDWLDSEYTKKSKDFDVLLRNLQYMLYRYKDDATLKERVNALIAKANNDYSMFLADNTVKIRERDLAYLQLLEKPEADNAQSNAV